MEFRDEVRGAFRTQAGALPGGRYRATLSTAVTDLAGNGLTAPFTWQFTIFEVGADSDGDGIPDGLEPLLGLDPNDADSDDDGTPDGAEDFDDDGLSNAGEVLVSSDPTDADSDDDGILDGLDGATGLDPAAQDRMRSAFVELRGRFELPGGGADRLRLEGRFGRSPAFDPGANDLTVRVRDGSGVLYEVTIPAGALEAVGERTFRHRGPGLGDLERLVLQLGRNERHPARLKLRTQRRDFSAVALDPRELEVELEMGGHTVEDARVWAPEKTRLVAGAGG